MPEARRVLADTVLPRLSPDARYQALMAIRAVSLVENQLRASAETEADLSDDLAQIVGEAGRDPVELFAKQIRTGTQDASEEVFNFLKQVVSFKLDETGHTARN